MAKDVSMLHLQKLLSILLCMPVWGSNILEQIKHWYALYIKSICDLVETHFEYFVQGVLEELLLSTRIVYQNIL